VVTICTTCYNVIELCTLHTKCICGFVILRTHWSFAYIRAGQTMARGEISWHCSFTAVPILYSVAVPASLYCGEYVYIFTHTFLSSTCQRPGSILYTFPLNSVPLCINSWQECPKIARLIHCCPNFVFCCPTSVSVL
jgi:hypothetical protein